MIWLIKKLNTKSPMIVRRMNRQKIKVGMNVMADAAWQCGGECC